MQPPVHPRRPPELPEPRSRPPSAHRREAGAGSAPPYEAGPERVPPLRQAAGRRARARCSRHRRDGGGGGGESRGSGREAGTRRRPGARSRRRRPLRAALVRPEGAGGRGAVGKMEPGGGREEGPSGAAIGGERGAGRD